VVSLAGVLDLPMDNQLEYARRLVRAGVPVELHIYPGSHHGFVPTCPKANISITADRDNREALRRGFHG
jgi:acetyl esterase/lipase